MMKELQVEDDDEVSPVEQVRMTVANTDDPTLPVWTFRMWFLGLLSCSLLAFLNQFFGYRSEPLIVTQITVQVASLPLGHLLARVLPARSRWMNPGRFNVKEHVLICIFANAGAAFSFGPAYAVGVVNIVKAFYGRSISFVASWLLIITTQVYGYMSMAQAVFFLADFKLGHYMKIPPKSMFLVQLIGTIVAGTTNLAVAWWLLGSIENICHPSLLPVNSPWTCPGDRVFFDASVIWGLVGPRRIFGPRGNYGALNWFFLGGAVGPGLVWLLHKAFPRQGWIPLINLPVLLGATATMPPATSLNFGTWIAVGTVFNFFVFRYRKKWWERYNYVLSAALDAGVAFMVLLYLSLSTENKIVTWWGSGGEHCPLASCPTAKGVRADGCPPR